MGEQVTLSLDPDLERIFGPGATRLANDYQDSGHAQQPLKMEEPPDNEEDSIELSDGEDSSVQAEVKDE